MLRVGLTGGIASGKSAVADRLAELGAVIIDADVLAREVVAAGTPGYAAVVDAFGPSVIRPDGHLDRVALAEIVFAHDDARQSLEAIVHPRVRARAAELLEETARTDPDAVVVQVIPLLAETGQADAFDVVVVVDSDPAHQLQRQVEHRGADPQHAAHRIAAQASRADRLAIADEVIENHGSLDDLREQVDALWGRLQARAGSSSDTATPDRP